MSALGSLLGGILGAGIGFLVGGPFGAAVLGAKIGFLAGSFLAAAFFAEGATIEGPRAEELRLTNSAYGKEIPILFGTSKLPSNVIWATDPPVVEIRHEESSGSNGFFKKLLVGPKITKVSFTYEATFAILLSAVEIGDSASLLKLYFNDELVADWTSTEGPFISEDLRGKIKFHNGSQDQSADPDMIAEDGVNNTSAYRGLSYVVFSRISVDKYGRTVPRVNGVVSAKTAPDVFPNVEILPSTGVGVGFSGFQWGPDFSTVWINAQGRGAPGLILIDASSGIIIREQLDLELREQGTLNKLTDFSSKGDKFYIVSEDIITGRRMLKYDVDTFKLEGVSEKLFGGNDRPIVFRVFGQLVDKLCVSRALTGDIYIVDATANVGELTLQHPTMALLDNYDISDFLAGAGWRCRDIIKDSLGHLWLIAHNIGDTADKMAFLKLDRGFGFPLQTFIINGQYDSGFLAAYDIKTNSIIVGSSDMFFRWSLDTESIVVDKGADGPTAFERGSWRAPLNGSLWVDRSVTLFEEYDTLTLDRLRTLDSGNWGSGILRGHTLYDANSHAIWRDVLIDKVHKHLLDRLGTPGTTTLREIVEGISTKVGLDSTDDLNASALTDIVAGYPLLKRSSAKSFIEPLAAIYFFDQREEDWLIDYVKRGGASVITIQESDLGAHVTGSEPPATLADKFIDELQLPELVDLTYIDADAQYEQGTQHWKRISEVVNTKNLKTIHVGVVLTADLAKQMLHKIMKLLWVDRDDFSFPLSRKHSRLSVADIIEIVKDGITHTVNLIKLDRGANGITEVLASSDDPTIYTSSVTGASQAGVTDENIGTLATSVYRINDLPAIRMDDAGFILYASAGGIGTLEWGGIVVHRSEDEIDFSTEAALVKSNENSSLGIAITKLGSATAFKWDRVNSFSIRIFNGSMSTATEINLLNGLTSGVNTLIVGNEIIQCATVVTNSDGTLTFSDLLRGRRGTEPEISNHEVGDLVTIVDFDKLVRVPMVEADVDKTLSFAIRNLSSLDLLGPIKSLNYKAAALMPMPVTKVNGSITNDDWTFTFHRRSRTTRTRPFVTPGVGESSETYECDILSEPGGDVKRKITNIPTVNGSVVDPTTPNVFYDDADQIIDFGSAQTEITFRIYMISSSLIGENADGRGFSDEVTLPRIGTAKDPYWTNVVTLIRFGGRDGSTNFIDYSNSAHTFTVLDTFQVSTAQAKFGLSSGLGDGSNSGLEVDGTPTDYDFGTGDFTIEAWLRLASVLDDQVICSRNSGTSDTSGFIFRVINNELNWRAAANAINLNGNSRLRSSDLDTQIHFSVSRKNGVTRGHIKGKEVFKSLVAYDITASANPTNIAVGDLIPTDALEGWIDEYRVTKGVGRYDRVEIDVPTLAFPRR